MYVDLDYNEIQSIENLINNRINELRIGIDGDAENEDEFKEIIRSYKDLLKKVENLKKKQRESNNLQKDINEIQYNEKLKIKINELVSKKLMGIENSNKTFAEILPPGFENILKVYIYNNRDEISKAIKKLMESDKVKNKLKEEITKFISGANPMIGKFINGENVCNKIIIKLSNYFDNDENMMAVIMNMNNAIDNFKNKRVTDFLMYVPYEGKKSLCDFMSNIILDFIKNKEIHEVMCTRNKNY